MRRINIYLDLDCVEFSGTMTVHRDCQDQEVVLVVRCLYALMRQRETTGIGQVIGFHVCQRDGENWLNYIEFLDTIPKVYQNDSDSQK